MFSSSPWFGAGMVLRWIVSSGFVMRLLKKQLYNHCGPNSAALYLCAVSRGYELGSSA